MKYLFLFLFLLPVPAYADDGGIIGSVAGAIAQAMDVNGEDDD